MRKVLSVCIVLSLAAVAISQTVDPDLLDLSQAKATIAGPARVYVRSILYDGTELSVMLVYNGEDGATIMGPYFAEDKYLQDSYDLDYTEFRITADGMLGIYDVVLGEDMAYSGKVRWDGRQDLRLVSFWQTEPPMTCDEQVAALYNRIQELEKQKGGEKVVEEKIVEKVVREGERELPTRTAFSGFSGGKTLSGSWSVTSGSARQSDTKQLFAKYSLPFSQNARETLYGFTARASGDGWMGYGLHFRASGGKSGSTYGFGKSFLLWITRDPFYYGTDRTYLQLYRSYDDVTMTQIASVSIPESIESELDVQVYYNRSQNALVAYVNGEERLEYYEVDPAIWSGADLALRTLGARVEFSGFSVKEK